VQRLNEAWNGISDRISTPRSKTPRRFFAVIFGRCSVRYRVGFDRSLTSKSAKRPGGAARDWRRWNQARRCHCAHARPVHSPRQ
jgi:hypothetical protein